MSEPITELIARVRDYDKHTSDADIDRLCDEIERLRAELADECELRKSYRCLPEEFHRGMLELLVEGAFKHAFISHGRAAELLGCSVQDIRERGWVQGEHDEEIERLRREVLKLRESYVHGVMEGMRHYLS